jgi:hypothetical protein
VPLCAVRGRGGSSDVGPRQRGALLGDHVVADADVDHPEPARVRVARREDEPGLRTAQRVGAVGEDRGTLRAAGVGVDPRGQIDRHDRGSGGVHVLDRAGVQAPRGPGRSGAQQRVDDDPVGSDRRADAGPILLRRDLLDGDAGFDRAPEMDPGIAPEVLAAREQRDARQGTETHEVTARNQAIAAVVPLPAQDEDRTPPEVGDLLGHRFGDAAPGLLHQGGAGRMPAVDRLRIDALHLGAGQDLHARAHDRVRASPKSKLETAGAIC